MIKISDAKVGRISGLATLKGKDMSKLEKLIQQYCPDGVEWKSYYDVCDLIRGITYNKSQEAKTETEDAHKVLRANNITLYLNALNFDDVKLVSKDVVVKPEQHLYAGDT